MRGTSWLLIGAVALAWWATAAAAQTVTVVHNVNLRPDPSSEYPPIRSLTPAEPPLTLLEPSPESGYYHVQTSAGEEGYVWSRYVRVTVAPAAPAATIPPGPRVPGSPSMIGCGDELWQHVYHPSRLLVQLDCVTVTGVIVDATAGQSHHHADGVRHEPDGDTHGWLQVDSQFADMIKRGEHVGRGGESRLRDRVSLPRHTTGCAVRLRRIHGPHNDSAGRHARRDHGDVRAGEEPQEVERDSPGVTYPGAIAKPQRQPRAFCSQRCSAA